jgi:aminomethyltransferase
MDELTQERKWENGKVSRFALDARVGTPFHNSTSRRNTTNWYFNWDLCMVPDEYEDYVQELSAIRSNVGMGDMSPLSKCDVIGPDATAALNRLLTRDISRMAERQIYYSPICTEEGHQISGTVVFKLSENHYRITAEPLLNWIRRQCADLRIEVRDTTDNFGILALQGPRSRSVLEAATDRDWSVLSFSRMENSTIEGAPVEVCRTGFTGELGYEIIVSREYADRVWDAVEAAGRSFGIRPVGEQALDIARVEAGLIITGTDYGHAGPEPTGSHCAQSLRQDRMQTPLDLGLEKFVNFNKIEFVGREKLLKIRDGLGPSHRLLGLEIDWRYVVELYVSRDMMPVVGTKVNWEGLGLQIGELNSGWASSVVWSPTTKKLIGFAHVKREFNASVGDTVSVVWRMKGGQTERVPARLVDLPFIELRREN